MAGRAGELPGPSGPTEPGMTSIRPWENVLSRPVVLWSEGRRSSGPRTTTRPPPMKTINRASRDHHPRIEPLDGRELLATLIVNDPGDTPMGVE
jgi:hypothetical protein